MTSPNDDAEIKALTATPPGWTDEGWIAYLRRRAADCIIPERAATLHAAAELAVESLKAAAN